jgi:hypothetical protein
VSQKNINEPCASPIHATRLRGNDGAGTAHPRPPDRDEGRARGQGERRSPLRPA